VTTLQVKASELLPMNFIIFLDIDGVLVHSNSQLISQRFIKFDPKCVAVLNSFCKKHKAKIVMSSTWRILKNQAQLKRLLKKEGVEAKLIGSTDWGVYTDRGKEIQQWIKNNDYNGDYVIIDDEIFDIKDFISKEKIIHVEHGFEQGGLKQEHIDEWEKQPP